MHCQRCAWELDQRLEAPLKQIVNTHNLTYDDAQSATCKMKQPIWDPKGLYWKDHAELPQKYYPERHYPSTNGNASQLGSSAANMSNQSTASICKILNVFNVKTTDWSKVMSQHPAACANHMKDTYHIAWNSGASMCIANKKNFVNHQAHSQR